MFKEARIQQESNIRNEVWRRQNALDLTKSNKSNATENPTIQRPGPHPAHGIGGRGLAVGWRSQAY
jgi:hypothetical protein